MKAILIAALAVGMSAAQVPDMSPAEREFQESMSAVVLEGQATIDGRDGVREDRYEIEKIEKQADGKWLFYVKVNMQGQEMTVPFPLDVVWAGDTPVITLTDQALPGRGTYTARVLVYRGEYAGTWSGDDGGGKVFGRVVKQE